MLFIEDYITRRDIPIEQYEGHFLPNCERMQLPPLLIRSSYINLHGFQMIKIILKQKKYIFSIIDHMLTLNKLISFFFFGLQTELASEILTNRYNYMFCAALITT